MKTMKKSVSLLIAALFICAIISAVLLVNLNYTVAEEAPATTEETPAGGSFLDTIREQFDLRAILSTVSSVVGVGSIASIIAFVVKLVKSRKSVEANTVNIKSMNSQIDELKAENAELQNKLAETESRIAEQAARIEDKVQRLIEHQLYLTSGSKLPDVAKEAIVRILDGKEVTANDEQTKG